MGFRLLSDAWPRAGFRRKTRTSASAAKHPGPESTPGLAWLSRCRFTVGRPPTPRGNPSHKPKGAILAVQHSLPPPSHAASQMAPKGGWVLLQTREISPFTCGNDSDLRLHQPFTIPFQPSARAVAPLWCERVFPRDVGPLGNLSDPQDEKLPLGGTMCCEVGDLPYY